MSIETSDSCSTTCTATSQSKSARPTLAMPERNSTRLRCGLRSHSDRIYGDRRLRLRLDSSARDGKGSLASLVSTSCPVQVKDGIGGARHCGCANGCTAISASVDARLGPDEPEESDIHAAAARRLPTDRGRELRGHSQPQDLAAIVM